MTSVLTVQQGWRYGLMGLPLSFVALPLYVVLPNYYARNFAVPLAGLGLVLLAVRLFDAVIDPLLGRWADRLQARPPAVALGWAGLTTLPLCLGFGLLFFPPVALHHRAGSVMLWMASCLLLTTTAYSALTILHQAWGARLGGDAIYRSQVVAWREGWGLAGIVIASISPAVLGVSGSVVLLAVAGLAGWLAWRNGPIPDQNPGRLAHGDIWQLCLPWRRAEFRRLMAVFMVNGIASALPATLMLFFVQDRLGASASQVPLFLGSYFVCAAASLPLWLKAVRHLGLAPTWLLGMALSVLVFAFATGLGQGDVVAFTIVCALSGIALGTDLAVPAAMLTGVIQTHGDQHQSEGAYFGWWAFASKLNLALAAGVVLPALGYLGYTPGATSAAALDTLTLAYCIWPCVLKTVAMLLLYFLILRKTS